MTSRCEFILERGDNQGKQCKHAGLFDARLNGYYCKRGCHYYVMYKRKGVDPTRQPAPTIIPVTNPNPDPTPNPTTNSVVPNPTPDTTQTIPNRKHIVRIEVNTDDLSYIIENFRILQDLDRD